MNEGEHGQEGDEKREKKHTIGEDDHDKTSDASRFPLAQLFKDGDAVRGMEISLVFCRPGSASIKNKKQKCKSCNRASIVIANTRQIAGYGLLSFGSLASMAHSSLAEMGSKPKNSARNTGSNSTSMNT